MKVKAINERKIEVQINDETPAFVMGVHQANRLIDDLKAAVLMAFVYEVEADEEDEAA